MSATLVSVSMCSSTPEEMVRDVIIIFKLILVFKIGRQPLGFSAIVIISPLRVVHHVILTKFLSRATLKVVKMITSNEASDENISKMTFPFQWSKCRIPVMLAAVDENFVKMATFPFHWNGNVAVLPNCSPNPGFLSHLFTKRHQRSTRFVGYILPFVL